jgi:hypothetical protein
MDLTKEIQSWFESQCDGSWEHQQGISIQSADNPGWIVKIDIRGTQLENKPFTPVSEGFRKGNNYFGKWLHCRITNGKFEGAGRDLDSVLSVFLKWALIKD